MQFIKDFYIFNSRILTHAFFWISYYVLFSLIWVEGNEYFNSFYLEFILLPIRIFAVYITIYFLLPKFLLKSKYLYFFLLFLGVLLSSGILLRTFIHFFYEKLIMSNQGSVLFNLSSILRAIVLINSTVLLIMSFKIFKEWNVLREKYQSISAAKIEIRANKRIYNLNTNNILYVEGLGNYVTFYTNEDEKLTSHLSLKKAIEMLPDNFVRIHKSYIINKNHVHSYNFEDIEINNKRLPVGKSFDANFLTIKNRI